MVNSDGTGPSVAAAIRTETMTTVLVRVLTCLAVYFWKTCGVFLLDMSYNPFEKWFSAVLFVSGLINIAITPWSVCLLDGWCAESATATAYRRLYTRMIACISLLSRAVVVYKVRRYLADYKRRVDAYDNNWPVPETDRRLCRIYVSTVVSVCLALLVPINLVRLYRLYGSSGDESKADLIMLLFFFNIYLQNWSVCCMETHFAVLCFVVYRKFRAINSRLLAIRWDVVISNRYPITLRSVVRPANAVDHATATSKSMAGGGKRKSDTSAGPVVQSILEDPDGRPLETVIEMLRVRHALMRESVNQLNNMFSVQLALSLITLYVMILFDIYNEAFRVSGLISRSKFIYCLMFQYLFRFFVIVITAHNTTQEVSMTYYFISRGA